MNIRKIAESTGMTPLGAIAGMAALAVLGSAIANGNATQSAAGILAVLLCAVPVIATAFLPRENFGRAFRWQSPPREYSGTTSDAGRPDDAHLFSFSPSDGKMPWLFRLCADVDIRLVLGEQVLYRSRRRFQCSPGDSHDMRLYPPLPGELHITVRLSLGDMFGLSRRYISETMSRSIPVLPRALGQPSLPIVLHSQNSDDSSPRKQSDSEKIFVRDYQHGDLARDINWKASSKSEKLLTRIAPESESQSRLLRVLVFSQSAGLKADCEYHFQLAALKGWVRSLLQEIVASESRALVWLNGENFEINSSEDLPSALVRLSQWAPEASCQWNSLAPNQETDIICSHSLSPGYEEFYRRYQQPDVQSFLVQASGPEDANVTARFFPQGLAQEAFIPRLRPVHLLPGTREFKAAGELPAGVHDALKLSCQW